MPIKVTSQQPSHTGLSSCGVPSRSSSPSRNDNTSSVEYTTGRRMQQFAPTNNSPSDVSFDFPHSAVSELRTAIPSRRLSIRDQKVPQGPRPQESPRRRNQPNAFLHSGNSSVSSTNGSVDSGNSRFSYRSTSMENFQKPGNNTLPTTDGAEFLAPVSFDDFHDSITGESTIDSFPAPGNGHTGSGVRITGFQPATAWSNGNSESDTFRRIRSSSVRQKNELPQLPGHSPTTVASSSVSGVTSSAARPRRQSMAQSTSVTTGGTARAPRKSIGPGSLPFPSASSRRPSMTARKASADSPAAGQVHNPLRPRNQHLEPTRKLESRSYGNLRNVKANSFHPPAKEHRDAFLSTPRQTELSRSPSTDSARTPNHRNASGKQPVSTSNKRTSVVQPHATGLGARTISPTDARRMKRMSMASQVPSVPRTPSQAEIVLPRPRSCAQSPSHVHRKSVTPSARATPDANRKPYHSGSYLLSTPNQTTVRNSGHMLHPKFLQNYPPSRIPTPKPRMDNNSAGSGEEEVPPVPAIPKAYGSPQSGRESSSYMTYKAGVPPDGGLLKPNRDSDPAPNHALGPTTQNSANISNRRGVRTPTSSILGKKHLQPLKLPPLNLLPISSPMASKIESFGEDRDTDVLKNYTPPTQRVAKTPTTPLTASKASFFAPRNDDDAMPGAQPRSCTSHFLLNTNPTPVRALSSSSGLESFDVPNINGPVSPYEPSSLPKHRTDDSGYFRQNPSGDYSQRPVQMSKLTGPRPQTQASLFPSNAEAHSRQSTPSETDSNSISGFSLRSQIALTRKRDSSRTQFLSELNSDNARHNNNPPRLPSSGNLSGVSTLKPASPNLKPTLLQSRHQSSLYNSASPVTKDSNLLSEQSVALNRTNSNDSAERDRVPGRSTSSILSPVHKIINSARLNAGSSPRSSDSFVDTDESIADEEMRKLNSKRKDLENSAKQLDELRRKAGPKERVGPAQALRIANLNIFERGEIIDFRDIYFCGTQSAKKHVGDLNAQSANFGYDDDRGDYNIVVGDHLAYRYEVVDVLGKGSFGQVVRCVDHKTGGLVAVKIIRNKKRFHQQALVEVNLLKKLKEWDPQHLHSVVNFTQSFYFRGHLCISTELLGMNLYEFIKAHDFKGFSLNLIRRFTKQILTSLTLLRGKRVIHCDLKPENILLVHPMTSEVRVIDFGSSCFENEKVYTYIQSRFYRSPEVILGMSYGMPIDMWSLGCILAELYTGYPIFPGENEQEQLACIMEVFGPPEKHLIEKSTRRKLFFDSLGKPRITVSSKGRRRRPSSKDLKQVLKCDNEAFLNFITRCLRWDPARRLTPFDALNHEFITGVKAPARARPQTAYAASKRLNTTSAPSRPLPEPPGTNVKNGTLARTRDANATGNSTAKSSSLTKRHPTVSGPPPSMSGKRVSNTTTASGSALPRVTNRSISGKPDLATAAATTSSVGSKQ